MSNTKVLRGQVRIAVKETLPEVLQAELVAKIRAELTKEFNDKFTTLATQFKETLTRVDQRSKEMQAYIFRQSAKGISID